jgi:hypothetical protein
MHVMRFLVRLGVVGLAAYGAKTLYDKYSPRIDELRGPANQFMERTSGAVRDAADEVGRAADDAKDESARRLQGSGTAAVGESPTPVTTTTVTP